MKTSEKIETVIKALFEVHKVIPAIKHDKYSDYGGYGYTSLEKIFEVVKPMLHRANLLCIQTVGESDNGVLITTRIQHIDGQYIEDSFVMPAVENKKMSIAQELGTAITYAKRYGISAILGIVTDEDNDAQEVTKKKNDYKQLDFKEVTSTLDNCESMESVNDYAKQLQKIYPDMTPGQGKAIKSIFDKKRNELSKNIKER